ncbi:Methylthioribulose-1-phosphate dehydratase MDE1 [Arthroderma uncinatum]|uniref:Methylthioribulose-1-phosphate dehydratase MDE1 n=1 Tax=Arthroderma uncinatum TaxID=74035 RepID=UPI00144A710A|nr:Methylthioribulose-1-phosphate dehydratase MDE1 [Arthroderma uncinatum]KAF3491829.1 Methylthioribulose-1-phosphate dehydratase MDE1 [Arthroderma uncinatum]
MADIKPEEVQEGNNDHLVQSDDPQHPANLIPELCRKFYSLGWVTGTGGGTSIRRGEHIFIAPSGVQKELIKPEEIFVLSYPTPKYPPEARKYIRKPSVLNPSACTPLFLAAFDRGAGCCIHTHSQWAVLVTLLVEREKGKSGCFEISNIEQIKGIPRGKGKGMLGFFDTLKIPIIENTAFEEDLTGSLEKAMDEYPDTYAVLVRRHGIYVWGDNPAKAKTQCESLDYLFQLAVQMHAHGLPWTVNDRHSSQLVMDLEGSDSPWGDVPSHSKTPDGKEPAKETQATTQQPSSSSLTVPQSPPTARGPRTPRKVSAQVVKLEPAGDVLDPLGPLGESSSFPVADVQTQDQRPAPPRKESFTTRNVRPTSSASQSSGAAGVAALMESVDLDEDGNTTRAKMTGPPPVQPAPASSTAADSGPKRQNQSISVEQAAKPSFYITVGDPHKVGDITSSHIVYQVRTKTTSKAYVRPEFAVTRRYRDFLWLYTSLHSNNPGIVVPPPPEKQAVGRFDTNFVESRRAALERMLNKIAAHPTLQHDGDLKIFLESEAFTMDVKNKENREPDLGQSKGMFSSLGLSAVDTVVAQRKNLAEAASDFSTSLHSLASVELSPALSGPLDGLAEVQLRIRELYERQAQQDVLTLGITMDEYIRLIGSVKMAFTQRQKSYHSWHAAESDMQKKKNTRDKLLRQGKSQQDRLNQAHAEVADAEKRVHQSRLLFEDLGRVMRNELERFEREKVEDFKSGVETFLESAVEAQKELIELWETFLLQLDSEDEPNPHQPETAPASESGQGHQHSESNASATSASRDQEEA